MTEVGNVYGQSLYELAKDEGLSREIGEQLTVLQKASVRSRILSVCSPTPAFPSRSGAGFWTPASAARCIPMF